MEKIKNQVKSFLKGLFCFLIACCLIPVLILSFVFVHYNEKLVGYVFSIKYPTLTRSNSKRIRAVIDTKQNAGIFHFLLQIKGPCDFDKIKRYYTEYLTDARDKIGNFKFPKLRQKLLSRWGHYFWDNDTSTFDIDNQVLLVPPIYRRRPVNETNVQEYVSEFCSKNMLPENPQWQVIVIPTFQSTSQSESELATNVPDGNFYILVKVHHMIMVEEEDLHVSDLLMLRDTEGRRAIDIDDLRRIQKPQSPLSYFVRKPVHIQRLLRHIGTLIDSRWNEFIYQFESLETPDGCHGVQITTISQLFSVLLILVVNTASGYFKSMQMSKKMHRRSSRTLEHPDKFKTLKCLLKKEAEERNLSWQIAYNAVCTSWHPANIAKTWTKFLWRAHINNVVLIPYHMYRELLAIRDLIFKGHTSLSSTNCGRLSLYLPMIVYALVELYQICYEICKAPVNIYEELFEYPSKESNSLQKHSLAGRKVVSFTKSIDATELRKRIHFNDELREADFVLACVAGAIHDFFKENEQTEPVPKVINTTCRTISKEYFTEHLSDDKDHIHGLAFLQLPLKVPDREHLKQVHEIVKNIRRKQIMIYLASVCQTKFDLLTTLVPRVFTKICINYFSFIFPVIITEIHGTTSEFESLWGQQVEDVLLFRPPQSKTGCSLNIHHYGDKYRLAVMADSRIGQTQTKIALNFENYMKTLTL